MNPKVDKYLIDGCMRCKYGATPQCKVNDWRVELETLRQIVLESGLTEDLKWDVPCYTSDDKNIVIVCAFKEYACLSFFKGALLADKDNILIKRGEYSQSARIIRYTSPEQIMEQAAVIKSYIAEAVALEELGQKVEVKKNPEPLPDELKEVLRNDAEFEKAFFALTPGRQRGYIIYFSQPKQSQSRHNRIEKYRPTILEGKGMNDM